MRSKAFGSSLVSSSGKRHVIAPYSFFVVLISGVAKVLMAFNFRSFNTRVSSSSVLSSESGVLEPNLM